jgi:hypothetical protein
VTHYTIDGRQYPRVRYGDEADDCGADLGPCHDCGVLKGQYHLDGCEVERCPKCGDRWITNTCEHNDGPE